jgi:DNA-binding GntR family transcriptional regulator
MSSPSATQSVLKLLRTDLITGHLTPGDQVVQETLAERYGVSRVPLREALRLLESEGLVTHEPHRGYFVTELTTGDLEEVYRLRAILETEAITAAVPNLSTSDINEIATLMAAAAAAADQADIAALTDANRDFHFAIFEASAMPRLVRLLRQLWDATDLYRSLYFAEHSNRVRVGDEHEHILAGLRNRDAQAVIAMHTQHRENSSESVSALLNAQNCQAAAG